jgi:hypothetical protein
MKAAETLILWNAATAPGKEPWGDGPPGGVAIGPLNNDCRLYHASGGAAYVARRKLTGLPQQFHVLRDYYMLVYGYGLHPYVVHRAFLLIDEYQAIIKRMGCGPDKNEPGHDPNVGYGRCGYFANPELKIFDQGGFTHFWPTSSLAP